MALALSVACVRGGWGLRAAVTELLTNSKDFRNFLRVPSEKSGQNPGRRDGEGLSLCAVLFHRCFTSCRATWFSKSWSEGNTGMWSSGRER